MAQGTASEHHQPFTYISPSSEQRRQALLGKENARLCYIQQEPHSQMKVSKEVTLNWRPKRVRVSEVS